MVLQLVLLAGSLSFLSAPVAHAQLYSETQTLFSGSSSDDYFGYDVAVSGDTLAVSAGSHKGVYVYVHSATTGWSLQQRFNATYSDYSLSEVVLDGDTLVAGNEIYGRSGGTWTLQQTLPFADPRPALQGDTMVIGLPYSNPAPPFNTDGAVYVYVRSGRTWTQQAVLLPDAPGMREVMGGSVAFDRDTIVASATGPDGAYVFVRDGTTWTRQARLPLPGAGSVVIEGDTIAEGDTTNNLVYILERSGTSWNRTATIPMPATGNAQFGRRLALSGGILAVSANSMYYLFSKTSSGWILAESMRRGDSPPSNVLALANRGKTFVLADPYDSTKAFHAGIVETFSVPPPPAEGSGWHDADVGAVGLAGSSDDTNGTVTVRGSGADIWDRADQLHFRSQSLTGDGAIVARVDSAGSGNPWSKVGLMFREDLAPASRNIMLLTTPGSHLGFQVRSDTADSTLFYDGGWASAPIWLMLTRTGDQFGAYRSADGNHWTSIGGNTIYLPPTIHVGLAVSSHDNTALNTGTFSGIEIVPLTPPGPVVAPSNLTASLVNSTRVRLQWTDNSSDESNFNIERAIGAGSDAFAVIKSVDANVTEFTDAATQPNTTYTYRVRAVRYSDPPSEPSNSFMITTMSQPPPETLIGDDLGTVSVPGAFTESNGVLTIDAAGSDIWDQADSGYFVHREITGDFDMQAQITSLTNTHPWAKAGLMARERLDAGSQNVFTLLTADNAAGMQVRDMVNGPTSFTAGPWVRAPYWVRLVRTGSTFQSFISADGSTWQLIGTRSLVLPPLMYVGVAVTSHAPAVQTRATVSSLLFNSASPP